MEGKIFCQDDFLLSGHSRSYKACTECSAPVTNKLIQVLSDLPQSVSPFLSRLSLDIIILTALNVNSARSPLEMRSTRWTKTIRLVAGLVLRRVSVPSKVYCLEDFCYLFGPKCGKCEKTIYPVENTALLIRVKVL